MKSKVRLSTLSLILTVAVTVILFVASCYYLWHGEDKGYLIGIILFFMIISGMLFGPVYISADNDNLIVKSFMRRQYIPISDIKDIELYCPGRGSMRLFGSGGYMGHWGVFRAGDIGKYVAYYGRSSECFLVRMKNGVNYLLSCENPDEMVGYVRSRLKH